MTIKYGKFEKPEKISKDESKSTGTNACFIAEPFERGVGHTVGNALRRILLSALEAPAIVSVRIEGVSHEYAAIEGVSEDMTYIILNFKEALLRKVAPQQEQRLVLISKVLEVTEEQIEKKHGTYPVTLKDVMGPSEFELVNPDHVLFSVTKPFSKKIDIRVGVGRGYVPSERHNFEKLVDEILIDSSFSPVRKVNYYVENTRVGQDTDFDRLILEIETDGRVLPQEALTFAAQIGIENLLVFNFLKDHELSFDQGEVQSNREKEDLLRKLALKINEIELSVRSTNCLSGANIETIGELVVMPESEMLKFRNFGKKSLTEIKQTLDGMGLSLEMDLSKYGIDRNNIKTVIQKFLEEHSEKEES